MIELVLMNEGERTTFGTCENLDDLPLEVLNVGGTRYHLRYIDDVGSPYAIYTVQSQR